MRKWLPYVGIVIGVVVVVYALFFSDSDEDQIRAKLTLLEEVVEVKSGQSNIIVRTARIKEAFAHIFVKEVSIQIPELTGMSSGRSELVGLAASAASHYQTARVDLSSLTIEIDDSKTSAHCSGAASMVATDRAGQMTQDSREVSVRLDKIKDEWLVVSIVVSVAQGDDDG